MVDDQFPEVMDIEQAAKYLGFSAPILYDMARKGEVPARKVRNKWRFSKAALDKWLAGNGQKGGEDRGGESATE